MSRTDKCGEGLASGGQQRFLERNSLVGGQHWFSKTDETIAVAHLCRNVSHFVPARLTLLRRCAKPGKRLQEKGLDIMWLEPPGVRTLHVLADPLNPGRIH